MKTLVTTESGTQYIFDELTARRLPDPPGGVTAMRQDGETLRLREAVAPVIGETMFMIVQPLSEGALFTMRFTTEVVSIEEVE
jgi:hypothetical protein